MTHPRLRFALLTAAFCAVVLALTACGGGGDDHSASADPGALLKDTFGADHPIRSGRLDANLDASVKGVAALSTPLNLHLSGPFQTNGGGKLPDFALDLDLQGGQNPVTVGAIFAQGGGWLTIEGHAFDLGSDVYNTFKTGYEKARADAAKQDKDTSQPTLSALGVQPIRWLEDPKNEGTEDIGGTQTIHITAGVAVPKLLDDISTLLGKARSVTSAGGAATGTQIPTSLSAAQRASIAKQIKRATVDVWTGEKDHGLRKVSVNVQLTTGHVIFQVTFAQLNQRQTIRKPAGAQPISQLRGALQQLGLVGSGSTTTPQSTATTPSAPSTSSGTSSSDPQAKYARCITDAGDDLAKVQDCAQYLSK
jgi:hypothetical protein